MKASHSAAQLRIDQARFWALSNKSDPSVAFYGSLSCNLADVIDESVPTACTNGKVIRWNPDWLNKLTDAQVRFVLFHEVCHPAHGHFWRLPINDLGNRAGDYVINAFLSRIPGLEMVEGGLLDSRFDGMAEEEVLRALSQTPPPPQPEPQKGKGEGEGDGEGDEGPQDGQDGDGDASDGKGQPGDADGNQSGKDPGGCGSFEAPAPDADAQPGKPAQPSLKEQWDRNLINAATVARSLSQGNAPAELQRLIDKLKAAPKVDWKQETADFAKTALATRNDWVRASNRFEQGHGKVRYPRRRVDNVGMVVFVRDTSGSIDEKLIAEFTSLIGQCTADLGCEALVIDADAMVQGEYRLAPGEEAPLTAKGGGGTDFRPAFERVAQLREEGERIAGLVYITDGYGDFPEPATVDLPTLWLSTTDVVAPVGRTVRIEVD